MRTANSIDLASRTLLVEVDVDNPTGELLPGAYRSSSETSQRIPSFILPVNTLIFSAESASSYRCNQG